MKPEIYPIHHFHYAATEDMVIYRPISIVCLAWVAITRSCSSMRQENRADQRWVVGVDLCTGLFWGMLQLVIFHFSFTAKIVYIGPSLLILASYIATSTIM